VRLVFAREKVVKIEGICRGLPTRKVASRREVQDENKQEPIGVGLRKADQPAHVLFRR
jgi:hypothetical protein